MTVPETVTSIGRYVFSGCSSLTTVTILEGVTSIGYSAFYGCSSLLSVTIPPSVMSISGYAFGGCSNLKFVYITDLEAWCKIEFCDTYSNPLYNEADLYINGEKATNIEVPDGVTSIGNHAFSHCRSLVSMTLPSSITSIGYGSFIWCSNLKSVYISDLETWCKIEFHGTVSNPLCNGAALYINGEKATNIEIPMSVTCIGDYAFQYCSSLMSVTIPASVTSIGDDAFFGCRSLTSIAVDENNAKYSSDERGVLFSKDKTTLIQYPIGNTATSYEIPSSVASIGDSAFYDCSSLTSVIIPSSVTSIDNYAFYNCSKLKDVYYLGTEEEWKNISIGSNNYCLTNATIHYNATVLTPSVTRTADGTVYKVSAANLPVSSVVVVALYKDGRFVGYESAVYNGETLEIAADTPHDTATILAWSDLEKLIPLAPGTKIGS